MTSPQALLQALSKLDDATRCIADIRSGAELVLEAIGNASRVAGVSAEGGDSGNAAVLAAANGVQQSLDALREAGKALERLGVLQPMRGGAPSTGARKAAVHPDGALLAYSWKRHTVAEATVGSLTRTSTALKAFDSAVASCARRAPLPGASALLTAGTSGFEGPCAHPAKRRRLGAPEGGGGDHTGTLERNLGEVSLPPQAAKRAVDSGALRGTDPTGGAPGGARDVHATLGAVRSATPGIELSAYSHSEWSRLARGLLTRLGAPAQPGGGRGGTGASVGAEPPDVPPAPLGTASSPLPGLSPDPVAGSGSLAPPPGGASRAPQLTSKIGAKAAIRRGESLENLRRLSASSLAAGPLAPGGATTGSGGPGARTPAGTATPPHAAGVAVPSGGAAAAAAAAEKEDGKDRGPSAGSASQEKESAHRRDGDGAGGGVGADGGAGGVKSSPAPAPEPVGVVEAVVSGVLRAVIQVAPCGGPTAESIAVFASDEAGPHVHAWGVSRHHVFRLLSERAKQAARHFQRRARLASSFFSSSPSSSSPSSSMAPLGHLLVWLSSYQDLFTQPCRKCRKVLAMESSSRSLLPPTVRLFEVSGSLRGDKRPEEGSSEAQGGQHAAAYHVECFHG